MKTKKLKGMTLIEVIVAIAVLGVAGMVMARLGSAASSVMLNTNRVNNKVNVEAPVVSTKNEEVLKVPGTDDFLEPTDLNGEDTVVSVDIQVGSYGTYESERFSTAALGNKEADRTDTNLQGDLEFYKVGARK
ncbi:MAG: type II secretion system protein [Ruminococcus sp.]|nr:type II secretion system protein [Ruminococcus sp.]